MSLLNLNTSLHPKINTPLKTSPLLKLPSSLRHQIYYNLGLDELTHVDLNIWSYIGIHRSEARYEKLTEEGRLREQNIALHLGNEGNYIPWRKIPTNLLQSCNLIHDEVEKIIYGESKFAISRRGPGGLRALEKLGLGAIRELRELTIRINLESCHDRCCNIRSGDRCFHRGPCKFPETHDIPLDSGTESGKELLEQWRRICKRLQKITPKALALYIICDCKDQDTAASIIEPLLEIPVLKDCALRLGKEFQEDQQALAEKTVRRLTGKIITQAVSPFRFLDLPREIQIQILSYTHLIRTNKPKPRNSESVDRIVIYTNKGFTFDSSCSVSGSASKQEIGGNSHLRLLPRCFCNHSHSAFTFNCNCEYNPTNFFLLNHHIRDLAIEVFFGRNTIQFSPSCFKVPNDSTTGKFPFLKNLPKEAFLRIRHLILEIPTLPEIHEINCRGCARVWGDWEFNITVLSRLLNIPTLKFDVRILETHYWLARTDRDVFSRKAPGWPRLQTRRESIVLREKRDREIYLRFFLLFGGFVDVRAFSVRFLFGKKGLDFTGEVWNWERQREFEKLIMGGGYDFWG